MATRTAPDLARAAELFHALSDRTRLSIIQRLRLGERCVCELTDALDAAQSRLSFHLKVLDEHLPLAAEVLADIVMNWIGLDLKHRELAEH